MAVTITSDLKFVQSNGSDNITWSVSGGGGQNSFERQYKLKGTVAWSTTGKISGTQTSYPVKNLYTPINNDFVEIWYRVVVYRLEILNNVEISSIEKSDVKSIMFHNGITGTLRLNKGSISEDYPMFSYIKNTNVGQIKVNVNGIKSAVMVNTDHPLAGEDKVNIGSLAYKRIAKSTPTFTASNIYSTGQLNTSANYQSDIPVYTSGTKLDYQDTYVYGTAPYSGYTFWPGQYYSTMANMYWQPVPNHPSTGYWVYDGTYLTHGPYGYYYTTFTQVPAEYHYRVISVYKYYYYISKYYTDSVNYNYTYYYGNWNN